MFLLQSHIFTSVKWVKNILLASSLLCSVNPSLGGLLAPWPVCSTDDFWTLGTFDSLRFAFFCVATHLWHGHNWPQVSNPISPRDQTQFCLGTQLDWVSNLSCAFVYAKLHCPWQREQYSVMHDRVQVSSSKSTKAQARTLCYVRAISSLQMVLWTLLLVMIVIIVYLLQIFIHYFYHM